ncbi:MAG TPA: hypothetical protein VFM38_10770 [Candidatus Limnocylindrales bacterium]|nr:hypothetical protein [Candidatus Limnocylindrales bacterium]
MAASTSRSPSRSATRPAPRQGPRLGEAFRTALREFYFNSWRLVPANLAWGACLVGLYLASLLSPLLALACLPLLALPTVGVERLAALVARGEPASLGDAFGAWRTFGGTALAIGVAATVGAAVFVTNVGIGVATGNAVGWALATLAAWGLTVGGMFLLVAWPLLVDPWRSDLPVRSRLRLAALLVLAHPVRIAGLGLAIGVILVASTIAFAALVMVSLAYVALVAALYLLPAADRLEAQLDGIVRAAPDDGSIDDLEAEA